MNHLTPSKDALAKALHLVYSACDCGIPDEDDHTDADMLIASGAVIDATTLADNETYLRRVAGDNWTTAQVWLRAFAAALTERGQ